MTTRSESRPPRVKPEHVLPEVEVLLARHRIDDGAAAVENGQPPSELDLPELRQLLSGLHPADIADVLEALPL
ncbi:MAG: magnesium transporter, partial [Candidatus Acidiferrales bacterium]